MRDTESQLRLAGQQLHLCLTNQLGADDETSGTPSLSSTGD
jgi:hypothetical protein